MIFPTKKVIQWSLYRISLKTLKTAYCSLKFFSIKTALMNGTKSECFFCAFRFTRRTSSHVNKRKSHGSLQFVYFLTCFLCIGMGRLKWIKEGKIQFEWWISLWEAKSGDFWVSVICVVLKEKMAKFGQRVKVNILYLG